VRFIRFLASAALCVVGGVLVLYGLYGLTFNEPGDPRGGTGELAGHQIDARPVGAVSLVLGLASIAAAIWVLRRGRVRS